MTLDEELVEQVDEMAKKLGTTRSGFTRDALKEALSRAREEELERKHRLGYERFPLTPEEIQEMEEWAEIEAWDDDEPDWEE